MKSYQEVYDEFKRLEATKDVDESGLAVRMVTMIALEWVMGFCPIAPSERLTEVNGELLEAVVDGEKDHP